MIGCIASPDHQCSGHDGSLAQGVRDRGASARCFTASFCVD